MPGDRRPRRAFKLLPILALAHFPLPLFLSANCHCQLPLPTATLLPTRAFAHFRTRALPPLPLCRLPLPTATLLPTRALAHFHTRTLLQPFTLRALLRFLFNFKFGVTEGCDIKETFVCQFKFRYNRQRHKRECHERRLELGAENLG